MVQEIDLNGARFFNYIQGSVRPQFAVEANASSDRLGKVQMQGRVPVDSNATMEVRIVDIEMSFWSMVILMVKAAIAIVPALIILTMIGMLVFGALGGVISGMGRG